MRDTGLAQGLRDPWAGKLPWHTQGHREQEEGILYLWAEVRKNKTVSQMQEEESMASETCFSCWHLYRFRVAKLTLNLSNQFTSQNTLSMWGEMLLNPVENWKMTQSKEYLIYDVKEVLPMFLWIYQIEQLFWHHWN